MKRFWSQTTVAPQEGGFGVRLDGKPVRLPSGPPLCVPSAGLANAIAAEWQQAGLATGTMEYRDVPLTRLAGTAQLRIAPDPAPTAAAIAVYGETDLLCYRAPTPPALAEWQARAWDPWLAWARAQLGAALVVTTGIVHQPQHPLALEALRRATFAEDAWVLAGLGIIVPALGSLVLGLAVAHGAVAAHEAHALSLTDELYQEQLWGEDASAKARRLHIDADIADAARLIELVR